MIYFTNMHLGRIVAFGMSKLAWAVILCRVALRGAKYPWDHVWYLWDDLYSSIA